MGLTRAGVIPAGLGVHAMSPGGMEAAGVQLVDVRSVGAEVVGMGSLRAPIAGVHARGATSPFGRVTVGSGDARSFDAVT